MLLGDRVRMMASMRKLAIVFGIVVLLAVAASIAFLGVDPSTLTALGYPGVALLMFLSSGSIFLPAPGFAAVLAAGTVWNPVLVGLAAGMGASTGELSGYLLGMGSGAVLDLHEDKRWRIAHRWLQRYGFWAILGVASIPNPVFDVLGVAAGSLSYPLKRFWLACMIGNVGKYIALAFLADSVYSWWILR